ncbi:MAG TPA: hypothetical protein VFA75_01720 [Nevskia sp.]|nr:hypothetical protein [Nevskia sp.]
MTLYDYIYVDLQKVISLYSQLTGGVVELRESTREHVSSTDNKRAYDLKVFKHDAGGTDQDKGGTKEVVKPHHALLTELEEALGSNGYLIDLTSPDAPVLKDAQLRARLKNSLCIKVCGRAVIEDYERIKGIANNFPEIVKIINKSVESNLRKSPAFLELQAKFEHAETELKKNKDKNDRQIREKELRMLKKSIEDLIAVGGK